MTSVRYLIILTLALVVSGCFAGRNVKPLTDSDVLEEPVAILPVSPENVVMAVESEKDYAKIAKKTNFILNILARGEKSKLIGPKKVRRSLEGMAKAECLNIWLDELRRYPKPEMSQELIEIGSRLKVKKIIRVKVDVLISGNEWARWFRGIKDSSGAVGAGGKGKHWRGWVDVTADLFDLSPPRHVTYDIGSAEYWGKIGYGLVGAGGDSAGACLPFPYAVGTTKTRALDQATRQAISGVLNQSIGQKPFIAEDHPRLSDLDFVHVAFEPANLHNKPSLDSKVVDKVWSGMALKVVKEKDNWLQVEAPSGKKGWIAKDWLVKDIQIESEKPCHPIKESNPLYEYSTEDSVR